MKRSRGPRTAGDGLPDRSESQFESDTRVGPLSFLAPGVDLPLCGELFLAAGMGLIG